MTVISQLASNISFCFNRRQNTQTSVRPSTMSVSTGVPAAMAPFSPSNVSSVQAKDLIAQDSASRPLLETQTQSPSIFSKLKHKLISLSPKILTLLATETAYAALVVPVSFAAIALTIACPPAGIALFAVGLIASVAIGVKTGLSVRKHIQSWAEKKLERDHSNSGVFKGYQQKLDQQAASFTGSKRASAHLLREKKAGAVPYDIVQAHRAFVSGYADQIVHSADANDKKVNQVLAHVKEDLAEQEKHAKWALDGNTYTTATKHGRERYRYIQDALNARQPSGDLPVTSVQFDVGYDSLPFLGHNVGVNMYQTKQDADHYYIQISDQGGSVDYRQDQSRTTGLNPNGHVKLRRQYHVYKVNKGTFKAHGEECLIKLTKLGRSVSSIWADKKIHTILQESVGATLLQKGDHKKVGLRSMVGVVDKIGHCVQNTLENPTKSYLVQLGLEAEWKDMKQTQLQQLAKHYSPTGDDLDSAHLSPHYAKLAREKADRKQEAATNLRQKGYSL